MSNLESHSFKPWKMCFNLPKFKPANLSPDATFPKVYASDITLACQTI